MSKHEYVQGVRKEDGIFEFDIHYKGLYFFYKLYTDLIFLLKDIEQVRNSLFCCQVDLYFKMEGILSRNKRF